MKLKIHALTLEEDELIEGELDYIPEGIAELWYFYKYESYEGSGYAILQDKKGGYYLHDMGHCSCYGPFDRINLGHPSTLEQLEAECSRELGGQLSDLFEFVNRPKPNTDDVPDAEEI